MRAPIVTLYERLHDDPRLQKDWERNQPGIDRALESVLIARTRREVATAALLNVKQQYEPSRPRPGRHPSSASIVEFARTQGAGG